MTLLIMPDSPPHVTAQPPSESYWRMTVVFVGCPSCGAHRGEACRGESFASWMGGVHLDRRVLSSMQRRESPEAWEKLKAQIYLQTEKEKAQ